MARPYRLVTLGRDDTWADALEARVREATALIVRHADAVEFARALAADDEDPAVERPHTVVAYLADAISRDDPAMRATLQTARDRLSVYDLTCRVRYDLTCRSRRGDHGMGSPPATR